jgi:hypothetical protein
VEENGNVEVVFCELGTAKTVSGCNFLLSGRKSVGTMQTLFLGTGTRHQDFDDRIELRGRDTQGAIIARGALSGTAKKVLRTTLDIIPPALRASKGSEQRDGADAERQGGDLSAPLLLSGESNVEGSHSAPAAVPIHRSCYYLNEPDGFSELDASGCAGWSGVLRPHSGCAPASGTEGNGPSQAILGRCTMQIDYKQELSPYLNQLGEDDFLLPILTTQRQRKATGSDRRRTELLRDVQRRTRTVLVRHHEQATETLSSTGEVRPPFHRSEGPQRDLLSPPVTTDAINTLALSWGNANTMPGTRF